MSIQVLMSVPGTTCWYGHSHSNTTKGCHANPVVGVTCPTACSAASMHYGMLGTHQLDVHPQLMVPATVCIVATVTLLTVEQHGLHHACSHRE